MKICIMSSNINRVEERVCAWSLYENGHDIADIYTFNTSTGHLLDFEDNVLATFDRIDRLAGATAFSMARFAVPGMLLGSPILIIDPDILALQSLSPLETLTPAGCVGMRKAYDTKAWATSVMFLQRDVIFPSFDDILQLKEEFGYRTLLSFKPEVIHRLGIKVHRLSKCWNNFDRANADTRLIHFTNLRTQPFTHDGHPLTALWIKNAISARAAGFLSEDIIEQQKHQVLPFDLQRSALKSNWDVEGSSSVLDRPKQVIADLKFHGLRQYLYNFLAPDLK
jgi:hypothetical protein